MNRLSYLSAYLVGPIDRCNNLGKAWRDDMKAFLQAKGTYVLDPLDKPVDDADENDFRDKRLVYKQEGNWDELRAIMKRIRAVDLRFVDKADFLVVNYDMDIHMCGTMEELFLANRSRKPILLMCPQGKGKISDWLYGTLPHQLFFESWDEVKVYLDHVDTAEKVDTINNRWLFFNR